MNDDIPVLDRLRADLVRAVSRRMEPHRAARSTRWRVIAATSTLVVMAAATLTVVALTHGTPPGLGPSTPGGPGSRVAPSSPGAPEQTLGGAADCVETFSLENLAHREVAFDGVVRSISVPASETETTAPTLVTFEVSRWYRGGSGERLELKTYERPGLVTSEDDLVLAEGARILGSGDGGFLWGCGFSMLYTPHNAAIFEAAFGG